MLLCFHQVAAKRSGLKDYRQEKILFRQVSSVQVTHKIDCQQTKRKILIVKKLIFSMFTVKVWRLQYLR